MRFEQPPFDKPPFWSANADRLRRTTIARRQIDLHV